jgi:hypothetical protein
MMYLERRGRFLFVCMTLGIAMAAIHCVLGIAPLARGDS